MNPILISVLSVLGTLSVVFIVWTVDGLRKAHKKNEQSKQSIISLEKGHDEIHRRIDESLQEISNEMTSLESNFQNDIRRHVEDVRLDYDARHQEIMMMLEQITSDLDRRFDKLYSKLYKEFPQLAEKKTNQIEQINS